MWQSVNLTAQAYGRRNPRYARSLEKLVSVYEILRQPDRVDLLKRQMEGILNEVMTAAEQEAARRLFQELQSRRG